VGQSAEELRREIEMTRDHMGETIDAIGDRVIPRRIVERRRNRMRASYWAARDAVMGRSSDAAASMNARASHAGNSITEGASHLAERATDLPHQATRQTQGSPLGAGMMAFGAGLVIAALIPPSEPEQQVASKVREAAEPLVEDAKEMGKELASTLQSDSKDAGGALKEAAQQAVGSVKETASSAAQQTKEAGTGAVHEMRDSQGTSGGTPAVPPRTNTF
jgi:histone H3/H4